MERRCLEAIPDFWREQRRINGQWMHPTDESVLRRNPQHPFNLDYPISPYVGDILRAEVVILGTNGGYSPTRTPRGFAERGSIADFCAQVASGRTVTWASRQQYYVDRNYYELLREGRAVVVNACAYRSQRTPPARIVKQLPSVQRTQGLLLAALRRLVHRKKRLVVAKRPGFWREFLNELGETGVVRGLGYVNPDLTKIQLGRVQQFLQRRAPC